MLVGYTQRGNLYIVELDEKQEKELKDILKDGLADSDLLNVEGILKNGKVIAKFRLDWFVELDSVLDEL